MIFIIEQDQEVLPASGQKRESGEKPERSGHCKRRAISAETIAGKVRREDRAQSIGENRKSGNLLSDKGELP